MLRQCEVLVEVADVDLYHLEPAVDQMLAAAARSTRPCAAVRTPVRAEHQQHLLVLAVRSSNRMLHVGRGIGLLVVGPRRCVRQHASRSGCDQEQASLHDASLDGYTTRAPL